MSSPGQPPASEPPRRRRLVRLGAVLLVAAVAVGVAIAVSSGGDPRSSAPQGSRATAGPPGAPATALLAGIPEAGPNLGRPAAPVRVLEFADLQCPFCADAARSQVPALIRRHVRPGRVRMEFETLAFIGPDSEKAARFVEAAGLQDRLWNAVELLYAEQGRENSGWVTDELLRRVGTAIPGLDVRRALRDMDSPAVVARLRAADALARRHRVQSTPTFLVGRRGGALRTVDVNGLPAAVDAALARR